MIRRYSKPLGNLFDFKADFFNLNGEKLNESKQIAVLYGTQPAREKCKNCDSYLSGEKHFTKLGIKYKFCDICGHLNGSNKDTREFCELLYTQDSGEKYAKNYTEKDIESFNNRLQEIYLPKAEFLKDSIVKNDKRTIDQLSICDFGTGAGYFVGAAQKCGFSKIIGYDISKTLVEYGNHCLSGQYLQCHSIQESVDILSNIKADVISLIGVLEHLANPREILDAIKNNNQIKYLFLSVPLFSPTVIFESVFEEKVMPRHLAAGHTHLYTEESIQYFCKEFGFAKISEWWFGLDVADLYRSIYVLLDSSGKSTLKDYFRTNFCPLIDELQHIFDKHHLCSIVHMLLKA